MPREANLASLLAWTLLSLALVATTARAVLLGAAPMGAPRFISASLSTTSLLLAVLRAPATTFRVEGWRTAPRALAATREETSPPRGRVTVYDPMPPFIA